ncbi:MAG: 2OG-Fe(II) oxygenase [Pseudomonadaceae bacterium]|jgi:SM-20-related protein|nr:2OG-Fe(II) oxygenase [Pseudomonadaceae bacterium]
MKMMPEFPFAVPDRLLSIADLLAEQGWAVAESGLAPEVLDQLERNCHALWQDEALRPAAVGRAGERQVVPEIRGDHIRWLDDCPPCAAQDAYVEAMARLRLILNRTLLLGLDNYETHYALYPPGAGYSRHLDRFKDNPLRTVSVVLYLNSQWQPGDGGELRLHLPEGSVDVAPRAGILAVFMSDSILHEVLPARRHRASLVGWFRRRPDNPLLR